MAKTSRGFEIHDFEDGNGVSCSLQESSAARDEGLIWLGCNKADPKAFVPNGNPSWSDIDLHQLVPEAEYFSHNTRMHLTQSMVKDLLPALQFFAENGHLPKGDDVKEEGMDRLVAEGQKCDAIASSCVAPDIPRLSDEAIADLRIAFVDHDDNRDEALACVIEWYIAAVDKARA